MVSPEPMNKVDQVDERKISWRIEPKRIVFVVLLVALGLSARIVNDRWPDSGWWPLVAAIALACVVWFVLLGRKRR